MHGGSLWRAVRGVSGASMTLYLWHMVPVLIIAAALYLPGLAPDPTYGSAAWWAWRAPWLLTLGALLVGVLRALRPLEAALAALYEHTRPEPDLRGTWPLWLGLAASVTALTRFAVAGFAHEGRFPLLPAVGLDAVVLVQLVFFGEAAGAFGQQVGV